MAVPADLNAFAEICTTDASLAPFTQLKLGGPADVLVQPRSLDELIGVVKRCFDKQLRFRILGHGGNVLVHDEGVKGIVLRFSAPVFTQVSTQGRRLKAGCGATIAAVIAHATRGGLAGLETLVGLPGTIGGALFSTPAIVPRTLANSFAASRCSIARQRCRRASTMTCVSARPGPC